VALVVHEELAQQRSLRFEPWQTLAGPPRAALLQPAVLRDGYFGAPQAALPAYLAGLASALPPSTLQALEAFAATPTYVELAAEWRALRDYRGAWSRAPFPPVFVTVDAVVSCRRQVLLIRRGRSPGKGLLALPGGFLEQAETTLESALRELEEETRLTLPVPVREPVRVAVFDHPERSQRGRTISHAFHFDLGDAQLPVVAAADDASEVQWVPLTSLVALESQLFEDHFHILDTFLRVL
jgi:bifunctional NMN adenylyltransferase/nudix hydrolase